jgi:hypothetical protein
MPVDFISIDMTLRFLSLISILSVSLAIQAQSWDNIKKNSAYLWGEGKGSTVTEADRNALSDLTSKITTHVSSTFDIIEEENSDGKKVDSKTYISNRVKTFSQATLNNTERVIIKNEPDAQVGRWIKRSEVLKIFENRLAKAKDLVETALRAETMGKVDDALRNYYWAYALVRSLQHPNEATFTTMDGQEHILMNWLKERMDAVFDDVQVKCINRKNDDVDLSFSYKGKPVTSIDYTFFDGRDWSNLYSAKDGRGVLELAKGNSNDNYQIKIEFEYQSEAHIDKEIESVLEVVASSPMRKSYKTVSAIQESKKRANGIDSNETFSKISETQIAKPQTINQIGTYDKTLRTVLASVTSQKYDADESNFTENGLDVYTKLLKYGTSRIIGDIAPKYYESTDGIVARGLKMSFSFKTGMRKAFVEDVIFYFDKSGKIDNITFGLGDAAETDILYKGAWTETARKAIMEFLENYKTAYALKRIDYIETVFDDDAVIIVGNVATRLVADKGHDGDMSFKNDAVIKHNRYTKNQYIKQLKRCFASNEFINIRFANNDVIKLGKGGETYAIQISQDYYSSTYGDKGYLFLMVDINDPNHPLIRLRTWQPEKDPNFGLYGPGDFK